MNRLWQMLLLWIILIVPLCMWSNYVNEAQGVFVTQQLGIKAGTIIDANAPLLPCPEGDEQMVLIGNNSDNTVPTRSFDCVGSECLKGTNIFSVTTTGAPPIITGTVINTFHFDGLSNAYVGSGTSTSITASIGEECDDDFSHCVISEHLVAVPKYNSIYVMDGSADTFGLRISLCRVPLSFPSITTDCLTVGGSTNDGYHALAIDSTTNKAFLHHGNFNVKIDRISLNGDGDTVIWDTTSADLNFNQFNMGEGNHPLAVHEGGNVFVGRRDTGNNDATMIVVLNQDLVEITSYNSGLTDNTTIADMWIDQQTEMLYVCGNAPSGAANISLARLSLNGTVLATSTVGDVGDCVSLSQDEVSRKMYMGATTSDLRRLNKDTLVVEGGINLPFGHVNSISIDELNHRIYTSTRWPFAGQGSIFTISTCSAI